MKTNIPPRLLGPSGLLTLVAWLCLPPAGARADIVPPPRLLTQAIKAPGLRVQAYWPGAPMSSPRLHYGIRTARNTGYSWVDAAVPVTYSLTVTDCLQGLAQIMLIAGANVSTNSFYPAYAESNVIRLAIQANTNGTAAATLGLKVQAASSDPPALASLTGPSMTGTWSLTLNGLEAVMQAPDGAQRSVDLPDSVLGAFADPMYVYFGGPGDDLTLSRVQISGIPTPIDDRFAGTCLDASQWQVCSPMGASVVYVPKNARFWLLWPGGNSVSRLQFNPGLKPPSWQDMPLPANVLQIRGYWQTPLAASGSNGFYRAVMNTNK